MSDSDWSKAAVGKRCVVFGAGPTCAELLQMLQVSVEFVVDNDKLQWGREISGIPVKSPNALAEIDRDHLFVIIGSTAIDEISAQLQGYGLKKGVSFVVPPSIGICDPLTARTHPQLLVSAIGHNAGLYLFDVNSNHVEKLFDGDTRGLAKLEDGYLVAQEFYGLYRLDTGFSLVGDVRTPQYTNLHGVCTDPARENIYVAETGRDMIGIYDYKTLEMKASIDLARSRSDILDQHHVNDVKWSRGTLYVSMFSLKGVFRDNVWEDGVIAMLDPRSGRIEDIVVNGLSQPHSIVVDGDEVLCCNSMTCDIRSQGANIFSANGYLRGLAVDGDYFYIGQSRMRRLTRLQGHLSNISLDSGIHVWNRTTKTSRFLHLPVEGVFDILPVSE